MKYYKFATCHEAKEDNDLDVLITIWTNGNIEIIQKQYMFNCRDKNIGSIEYRINFNKSFVSHNIYLFATRLEEIERSEFIEALENCFKWLKEHN